MDIRPLHPLPRHDDRAGDWHRRYPRNVAYHRDHRRVATAFDRPWSSHASAVAEPGVDAVYVVDDWLCGSRMKRTER